MISTVRHIRERWAPIVSLLFGVLLLLPMSQHGTSDLVLCVEKNGAVNVEPARGGDCGSSAFAVTARGAPSAPPSQQRIVRSENAHCVGCTDVPLFVTSPSEPCESAVRMGLSSEERAAEGGTFAGWDLDGRDRHASRAHAGVMQPRRGEAAAASLRRQHGHLYSDTSVVRAKSSVELLISTNPVINPRL